MFCERCRIFAIPCAKMAELMYFCSRIRNGKILPQK